MQHVESTLPMMLWQTAVTCKASPLPARLPVTLLYSCTCCAVQAAHVPGLHAITLYLQQYICA